MARRAERSRGARLRDVRKARDLSQAELAQMLGMSKNTIGAMERGEMDDAVHLRHWRKVASFFGIPLQELYRPPRHLGYLSAGETGSRDSPHLRDIAQSMHAEYRGALAAGRSHAEELAREELSERDEEEVPPGSEDPLEVFVPDEVDGLHRTVPREWKRANWHGRNLQSLAPDMETRRRVLGVLSSKGLTLYELEALVFVASVTHSMMAASLYKLRPEDYFGRLAALHRAVEDGNYYGRGYEFVFEAATMSEIGNDHQPDRRDNERYQQAINRWRLTHGPTLKEWTADTEGVAVGPWWDPQFEEEEALEGSLARELPNYIGPWDELPKEPEASDEEDDV